MSGLQHCIAILIPIRNAGVRVRKFDTAIIIIVITKYLGMTSANLF